jgi:hypothetical protein
VKCGSVTVQAWLGHESIATTNIYLHHLGSSADRAGLDRLNAPGGAGGPPKRGEPNDRERIRESCSVRAGQRTSRMVELRGFEPLTFSLRRLRNVASALSLGCLGCVICARLEIGGTHGEHGPDGHRSATDPITSPRARRYPGSRVAGGHR